MNPFAYHTTGIAIKALSNLSKARILVHGKENIPAGSIIFTVNHFTRIETILLPYYIDQLIDMPIWSLASYELFQGVLSAYFDKVGVVSTKNPHRDHLIVKTLLTGEGSWIIFPEGRMVKNKKIVKKGRFVVNFAGTSHPPHTGPATLALRTEFYRERFRKMAELDKGEVNRLMELFKIESVEPVLKGNTHIVPVNITYYPVRVRENLLSDLASFLVDDIPERMLEEIMTEGTMLLSGIDIDIRFGEPININEFLKHSSIKGDIHNRAKIGFDDDLPSKKKMRKVAVHIMQHYMSAIYDMVTVNYDHIFSSLLRLTPWKKISRGELKRKAFLGASREVKKAGVHLHKSLYDNQTHIMTDDRYHRFEDFISLAHQNDIINENEGIIIKDREKLSRNFLSPATRGHLTRIDNPVAVMANEIEPLQDLQGLMRRLAWKPSFLTRRSISSFLIKKAISDFEKDYKKFYVAGESKGQQVGRPFLIKGRSREIGIVLVHGYMAAPLEVKALADYLGKRGFWVYVPRVKGHGTSPDDLAIRRYTDWIDSVDEGYAIISNMCRKVVAGGFSNGAGLALDLAARVDAVKAVFAVCPPMRLKDFSSKFVPAVDAWNKFMDMVHIDSIQKEFIENKPENPHINYFRNPISGVRELERLMESVETKLPDITKPALVIQAYGDQVVDPRGSQKLFELLGSQDKQYLLFNEQRHGIILGEGSEKVHRAIGDFISRL